MNTSYKKRLPISSIMVSVMFSGIVHADMTEQAGSVYYTNRAYSHAIHAAPNPVVDSKVNGAKIVYVNQAYGPAIYSYPATVAFQETEFNVEYVDSAFGQAIYSYPNNNPVKHYLELSRDERPTVNDYVLPVNLR